MNDFTVFGSLIIWKMIMLVGVSSEPSPMGYVVAGVDKYKKVRLHTFHGVGRADCEEIVAKFAKINGFNECDLQCEWVCREYI